MAYAVSENKWRLGKLHFTDFELQQDVAEITSFGQPWRTYTPGNGGMIRFGGYMPLTEGSQVILSAILNGGGIDFLQERHEWRCVWCASPNPIDHRHCSRCGGPRGWIL